MSFILIYITHPNEVAAQELTNQLIEERLVACANIFPIQSAYLWKGSVVKEGEWVSIVKTQTLLWEKVSLRIEDLHPYEVPCIMKINVEANQAYEEWIVASTTPI